MTDTVWPFGALERGGYDLILADPPWMFENWSDMGDLKSPQMHYGCMSLASIIDLDASRLAAPHCWLLLWATAPLLPEALQVMSGWGFDYKTNLCWVKRHASGAPARGLGKVAITMHELLLIGAIGKPWRRRPFASVIDGVRREHSRKPDELYPAIDAFMPEARKVELFARARQPGWDVWGNQTDLFPARDAIAIGKISS